MKIIISQCTLLIFFLILIGNHKFYEQKLINKKASQNLQINICDDDNDGRSVFDIKNLEDYVLQTVGSQNASFKEQVLISTYESNIFSINFPSSNADISMVCETSGSSLTDIAVNSDKEIFICNQGQLLTTTDCKISTYPYTFSGSNSLSFDNLDNAYLGFGNESYVLNFNIVANDLTNFREWHDFEVGTAGGDFVLLNDKMYVSWKLSDDNYRLYEVTINTNREYISHVDLGQLPNETYGLASELGTLYGVTPNKLFKIELDGFSFTDIIQNPNPQDQWYGATGLHEAIIFNQSTHLSLQEAENKTNTITGDWINTIDGGQTVYIRIENSLTKEYEIIPLELNIYKSPDVNKPEDIVKCINDSFETFDLNEVVEKMKKNDSDDSNFTFYNINPRFNLNATPIDKNYTSTRSTETIYVQIDNGNCELIYEFLIINNETPKLLDFSNEQSPNLLEKCYFDDNDIGYFNLNDINEKIVLENKNVTINYYLNLSDAEDDTNKISNIFYLENLAQEIYARVTDENGCYSITNFFLNEECLQNENPLLYVTFPKFMTPNNDNLNDYWNIIGGSGSVINNSTIKIYNRFGQELFSFMPKKSEGWDGTFNGKSLPESNYWFLFTTETGLKKTGYFSIVK